MLSQVARNFLDTGDETLIRRQQRLPEAKMAAVRAVREANLSSGHDPWAMARLPATAWKAHDLTRATTAPLPPILKS